MKYSPVAPLLTDSSRESGLKKGHKNILYISHNPKLSRPQIVKIKIRETSSIFSSVVNLTCYGCLLNTCYVGNKQNLSVLL